MLAVVAARDDRLTAPVEFVTGFTPFRLKPWTRTGLANFSGTAVYEREFTVPEPYAGKRLILDCGRVSSVAEVAVNGKAAGRRSGGPTGSTSRTLSGPAKTA